MAHEFDSGMFVNSALNKEWHGLGTVVATAPKTTQEAMQIAGMDWTVQESPVITFGDNDSGPCLVEGHKVLRRSDNKKVLHVCRDSWTPVQNSEAFNWFDPIIADGDAEISAAVSLQEGKRIAITAKITGGVADVVSGDPIEAFLLLFNSHDGTLSLGVKFTNVRVVCTNTLAMALQGERRKIVDDLEWNGKTARIKHTRVIHDNLNAVRDALDIQRRSFRYTVAEYRQMAQKSLNTESFEEYIAKVFSKQLETESDKPNRPVSELRHYEQIVQNFESGLGSNVKGVRGTLWGAYNAVTEWTSHQRSSNDAAAARDRLNSLWFGSSSQINETAHSVAMAMV